MQQEDTPEGVTLVYALRKQSQGVAMTERLETQQPAESARNYRYPAEERRS